MTKVFVTMSTGYCGEESTDVIEVDYTPEQLSSDSAIINEVWAIAQEMAMQNAESYGREICCNDGECEDITCEFEHSDYSNIEGVWEIYSPEHHNMLLSGNHYLLAV